MPSLELNAEMCYQLPSDWMEGRVPVEAYAFDSPGVIDRENGWNVLTSYSSTYLQLTVSDTTMLPPEVRGWAFGRGSNIYYGQDSRSPMIRSEWGRELLVFEADKPTPTFTIEVEFDNRDYEPRRFDAFPSYTTASLHTYQDLNEVLFGDGSHRDVFDLNKFEELKNIVVGMRLMKPASLVDSYSLLANVTSAVNLVTGLFCGDYEIHALHRAIKHLNPPVGKYADNVYFTPSPKPHAYFGAPYVPVNAPVRQGEIMANLLQIKRGVAKEEPFFDLETLKRLAKVFTLANSRARICDNRPKPTAIAA